MNDLMDGKGSTILAYHNNSKKDFTRHHTFCMYTEFQSQKQDILSWWSSDQRLQLCCKHALIHKLYYESMLNLVPEPSTNTLNWCFYSLIPMLFLQPHSHAVSIASFPCCFYSLCSFLQAFCDMLCERMLNFLWLSQQQLVAKKSQVMPSPPNAFYNSLVFGVALLTQALKSHSNALKAAARRLYSMDM